MNQIAVQAFSGAQLQVIQRTVAKDTNQTEFDMFIETCKLLGLNPLKRQIGARVYNKDKPSKRQMAIITEIGGLRSIAARQGDYRPSQTEPEYFYSSDLRDPETNPLGIERCVVDAFKLDPSGQWQRCVGVAFWDEFAPVEDDWVWGDKRGERKKTGKKTLGGNWKKMPRLMIAKCAEAQALRKGWPEDLGALYTPEETDIADVLPTEALEAANAQDRQQLIGAVTDEFPLQFSMGDSIEMIPAGQVVDRALEYAKTCEASFQIKDFQARNSDSLKRFWASHKSDALELKTALEDIVRKVGAFEAQASADSDERALV